MALSNYPDIQVAEQLIIDMLTGQAAPAAQAQLREWAAAYPEVDRLWKQMTQVYELRGVVHFEQSLDMDAAWKELREKSAFEPVIPAAVPRNGKWYWYAAAAVVAGLLIISSLWVLRNNPEKSPAMVRLVLPDGKVAQAPPPSAEKPFTYIQKDNNITEASPAPGQLSKLEVPIGKDYQLQLNDGTHVWLNAASTFGFPLQFAGKERHVELNGEAYFEVAQQAGHPFEVLLGDIKITVLGTSFNVKAYDDEQVRISLIEGKVLVSYGDEEQLVLLPGEAAVADKKARKLYKEKVQEATAHEWIQGKYYFEDESLLSISKTIERWFGVTVTLQDNLAQVHFTGALDKDKPLTEFLDVLANTGGNIQYKLQGKELLLQKKPAAIQRSL